MERHKDNIVSVAFELKHERCQCVTPITMPTFSIYIYMWVYVCVVGVCLCVWIAL